MIRLLFSHSWRSPPHVLMSHRDLMPKRTRRERPPPSKPEVNSGEDDEEIHPIRSNRLDHPRRRKRRNSRQQNDYGVTSSWTCERNS